MTEASHPKGLAPGTVIGGRFKLRSLLGEGGTAHVFHADDLAVGGEIAIKILKRRLKSDSHAAERLDREGRLLSSLVHPGIVRVETWGEGPDGTLFLAMELLTGESLRSRMQRSVLQPGELTPILRDVTAALSAAHEAAIIHRDLKPDNLFLVPDDPQVCVKLLDFGVSKVVDTEKLTRTGQILGTPRYMAPEQLAGDSGVDHRVDIYSMGVILYEALSGQAPFRGTTPSELIVAILRGHVIPLSSVLANCVPEIEALVERAIAKEPANRFESVGDLYAAWTKLVPPEDESKRKASAYRTAAMGKLLNPLPGGVPEEDQRPSRSGTFSGLPAVEKSEMSADTLTSFEPPPGVDLVGEPLGSPRPAQVETPEPEVRPRRVPATAELRADPVAQLRQAPVYEVSNEVSSSRYHPRRQRGFWSTLKRAHFAGMVFSAVLGAVAGGAWVVWTVTQSSVTAGPVPPGLMPPVQEHDVGEPDIILREAPAVDQVEPEPTAAGVSPVPSEATRRPRSHSRHQRGQALDEGPSTRGAGGGRRVVDAPGAGLDGDEGPARSARELARAARTAFRQGRLDECVGLASQAYRAGALAALLTRGDCLHAQSSTASALKDYQRFCRLHPEHRSSRAARARARRLGGSCP